MLSETKPKFTARRMIWVDCPTGEQWIVDADDASRIVSRYPNAADVTETDSANADLDLAAPDLYAYAEAEEKSRQLWELGEVCYRGDGPTIEDYFEALERDFPEIAAKCPFMSETEANEWYGPVDPIWARWNMYYLGEGEESIGWLMEEYLVALRTAALAKARGEAQP
jgi:hypothetical protein